MSNRNRTAGHNWERQGVKDLKHIFPDIVTSRSESKRTDDKGIDFCYTEPFQFQFKTYSKTVNYHKIMNKMKDNGATNPVIMIKQTRKAKSRFVTIGKYMVIDYELGLKLIENYVSNK